MESEAPIEQGKRNLIAFINLKLIFQREEPFLTPSLFSEARGRSAFLVSGILAASG